MKLIVVVLSFAGRNFLLWRAVLCLHFLNCRFYECVLRLPIAGWLPVAYITVFASFHEEPFG